MVLSVGFGVGCWNNKYLCFHNLSLKFVLSLLKPSLACIYFMEQICFQLSIVISTIIYINVNNDALFMSHKRLFILSIFVISLIWASFCTFCSASCSRVAASHVWNISRTSRKKSTSFTDGSDVTLLYFFSVIKNGHVTPVGHDQGGSRTT